MSFIDFLVEEKKLSARNESSLRQLHSEQNESWGTLVTRLGLLSEDELADCFSKFCKLARAEISLPLESVEIPGLSIPFLRQHSIIPLAVNESQIRVAVSDPLNEFGFEAIRYASDREVVGQIATATEIQAALDQVYPTDSAGEDRESLKANSAVSDDDIERLRDLASEAPVIRLVQRVVTNAIDTRASDIHFEPMEDALSVRYRIDGMLKEAERFPVQLRSVVVSRIKIMAQLNIAERRLPQDGRISLTIHGRDTDFRVATTPTLHGESVVLRVLDRRDVTLDFSPLGFADDVLEKMRNALSQPHGIILVTGPTGSGKTTTLYAALSELNSETRKILTAEDPIEYTLPRVNQVQIRPQIGHDFAHALRAFLRQDPDIIMVGEIRDVETARIAIQAALTGHLILSTLHTNSAAAAVTRLLDMGAEEYLLSSTLMLVIGQRLVRKLCPHCRTPYAASAAHLERFALAQDQPASATLFRATGCGHCKGTGYTGRVAIVEVLQINDDIRGLIASKADAHQIEHAALKSGMRSMSQDGALKALAGLTSIEEVLRVTQNL